MRDRECTGDRVRVWMDRPGSAHRRWGRAGGAEGRLQVVYEDPVLIVVNKPAGLLTVPLPRRGDEPCVEEQLAVHLRSRGKRKPLVSTVSIATHQVWWCSRPGRRRRTV
jgi:23S rRNA-/tRNA-specific pseudouridylate synthase